jgi:CBS domain containing-hemolysin-like protein
MSPLAQWLVMAVCLLAAAFFSGMETGVISVNRLRLFHLAQGGSRGARILEGFLRETDRLLGTTLIGTNLSVVVLSTLAASMAAREWGSAGQVAADAAASLAVLVLGEYFPKVWFNNRPLARSVPLAFLLRAADRVLRPVTLLVLGLAHWIHRTTPQMRAARGLFVTREHLQILARDSEAGGQISAFERLMINRVLDLQIQTVTEIMTPLDRVARVTASSSLQDCADSVRRHGHLRLPVFDDAGGSCIGVLYMQEALAREGNWAAARAETLMRPAFFVDRDLRADEVLPLLRRNRQHMAVVRAPAGRVIGIVTMENVLKALVGNLPLAAMSSRRARTAGTAEAAER